MIKSVTTIVAAGVLMLLVGCGGSSSFDLPTKVFNEETVAVELVDLQNITPDDGVGLYSSLSGDMDEDERPRTRLLLSGMADQIDFGYRNDWDDLMEAGVQTLMRVHYLDTKTEGEGDNERLVAERESHVFVYVDSDASTDDLKKELSDIVNIPEDDMELEKVGEDSRWYWVGREGDNQPDMPDGGSEEIADEFDDLIADAGGDSVVTAWRMTEKAKELVEQTLEDDNNGLTDAQEDTLEQLKSLESLVMSCSPGSGPSMSATLTFGSEEVAQEYASDSNEAISEIRGTIKRQIATSAHDERAESLPTVDEVDSIVDSMSYDQSGKTVTLEMSSDQLEDIITYGALEGISGRNTALSSNLNFGSHVGATAQLSIPDGLGLVSCYRLQFFR